MRENDKLSLAKISFGMVSWTYLKMGNYEEAEKYVKQSILTAEEIQDHRSIARGIRYLGKIAREQNKLIDAQKLAEKALEIAQQQNDETLQFHLYSDLGQIDLRLGNYREAELKFKKALSGFKKLNVEDLTMAKLIWLGAVLMSQKKYIEVFNIYQECLAVSQKYGRKDTISRARLGLAKILEIRGNLKEALDQVKDAYILFEKLGMKKLIVESQEMIDRIEKK